MKRLLAVLYLSLLFPTAAHAYSDPGSGIMMWQLTVSFFIGLMFYFRRFVNYFVRLRRKDEE